MPEVISSDMPGTEQFEGQSMEELGASLPQQGAANEEPTETGNQDRGRAAGAGETTQTREEGRSTGAEGTQAGASAASGTPTPEVAQAILDRLSAFEKTLANLGREQGTNAARALQSRIDRLEAQLRQSLTQQPTPALTPEQQTLRAQQEEAQKFIDSRVGNQIQQAIAALRSEVAPQLAPILRQQYHAEVQQRITTSGYKPEVLNPIIAKILDDDRAAAESGDPQALARLDKVVNGRQSDELLFRAMVEHSKNVQAQGARVSQEQGRAADKGGRAVAQSGQRVPAQGKTNKSLEDYTPNEIDSMKLDELEKLIPRQQNRR
jgi:hypothetical protein